MHTQCGHDPDLQADGVDYGCRADSQRAPCAVATTAGPGWLVRNVLRDPCRIQGGGGCDLWAVVLHGPAGGDPQPWRLVMLHVDEPQGIWEELGDFARSETVAHALAGSMSATTQCDLFDAVSKHGYWWAETANFTPRCHRHGQPKAFASAALTGLPGPDGDVVRMLAALRGINTEQSRPLHVKGEATVYDTREAICTWSDQVRARHLELVNVRHRPGRTPVTGDMVVQALTPQRDDDLEFDNELLRSATFPTGGITLTMMLQAVDRWFASLHPIMRTDTPACLCDQLLKLKRRVLPQPRGPRESR